MKRALVVRGGWDGHEPKPCSDLFIPWLESEGYKTTVSDTLDAYLDPELNALDVIVQCWTMGEITGDQEKALCAAVKEGVGLAGWHGGLCDAFRASTEYQYMTGGQWVSHPGGIIEYDVTITQPDDPIMAGLSDFHMKSEQYYLHVDPKNEVLATTVFSGAHHPWVEGCVMPQVWKRHYGQGRVFYSALGHVASDFDVPECMTIMKRGILWASR